MKNLSTPEKDTRNKVSGVFHFFAKLMILIIIFVGSAIYSEAQTVGNVEISTAGGYGEKNLKKAQKKIFISEFRVMYQLMVHKTDEDKGGRMIGGGLRGDTKASLTVGIKGVDVPDLKEITNKLYAEYTERLKSQGFTLVSIEEASKAPTYEGWELKTGGVTNDAQFSGYLMNTPDNYNYMVKRTTEGGKEKKGFLDISGKLSKDLGGAIVTKVNLVIPLVEDAESAGSKMLKDAAGGIAKVVLRPNLRLTNEGMLSSNFSADVTTTRASYQMMKSMGEQAVCITTLKKNVEIAGVVPDKKYKATATAGTDFTGVNMGYFTLFSVDDEIVKKMQVIDCDKDKYVKGVTEASLKFLNASLDELFSNAN